MPVGCGWCPRVWRWQLDGLATRVCGAMADGRGWRPRAWRWQLGVVGVHVFGGASWMWLVPACVAVALGCDWAPTCLAVADECGCIWMWLMPTCVARADECGGFPIAVAVGGVWFPRVCRC